MVTTQEQSAIKTYTPIITWQKLPDDFQLEDEPVENTGQPLLAGALRESLEVMGLIKPEMLIASNFGLCATVNDELVIKAPDWVYVKAVQPIEPGKERKSYTPNLQGDVPSIVMEFLSDIEGSEYSVKPTYPPGKWYFYEQILQVPIYVIFEPANGILEVYRLQNGHYQLDSNPSEQRYWIEDLNLYLGVWHGQKEERLGYWLRWWDEGGNMLPWAVEKIEQERQRAEKLAEFLRSQGFNPDEIR